MPWVRKRRAEPAAPAQRFRRQAQNGERQEFLLRRRRIRGENCGDRGVWLARDLLIVCTWCVQNLSRAGGVASIAGIVTPSGPIWFHPPLGNGIGAWGLPSRTGDSALGKLRSAL